MGEKRIYGCLLGLGNGRVCLLKGMNFIITAKVLELNRENRTHKTPRDHIPGRKAVEAHKPLKTQPLDASACKLIRPAAIPCLAQTPSRVVVSICSFYARANHASTGLSIG